MHAARVEDGEACAAPRRGRVRLRLRPAPHRPRSAGRARRGRRCGCAPSLRSWRSRRRDRRAAARASGAMSNGGFGEARNALISAARLTGGMKAISLPSRGASSQRAKAPSTATRRRSTGSAKPWRARSSSYSARRSGASVSNGFAGDAGGVAQAGEIQHGRRARSSDVSDVALAAALGRAASPGRSRSRATAPCTCRRRSARRRWRRSALPSRRRCGGWSAPCIRSAACARRRQSIAMRQPSIGSGWQNGISSCVRLTAIVPAMIAVSTMPPLALLRPLARSCARHVGRETHAAFGAGLARGRPAWPRRRPWPAGRPGRVGQATGLLRASAMLSRRSGTSRRACASAPAAPRSSL